MQSNTRPAAENRGPHAVDAVLFDFGGTLDADGLTWRERVARCCRDEGVAIDAGVFDSMFYAADDALVGGVSPTLSFRETVARLVSGVARGLGLGDDAPIDRVTARFVENALHTLDRNRSLLTALGQRYRLGLVSNFYGNLAAVCQECRIHDLFEVILDSTDVGWTKPDPRIFLKATEALGLSPAAAVFVGDSLPRDMAGARAAGMPHIWLSSHGQDGACCPGDPVIRSLTALPEMLL
jgi:putative hydrolase of the HAD superfamily